MEEALDGAHHKRLLVVTPTWNLLPKSGELFYYKEQSCRTQGKAPKGMLEEWRQVLKGDECAIMCAWPKDAPSSCRFAIPTLPGRVYYFYSHSAGNCGEWLEALDAVLRKRTNQQS